MNKGKLIVFEGADGAGKTTQAKLLVTYLKKRKIPTVYISFPRYEESLWGKMIRRYLDGDFGKLEEVDPYLAACLYAGDRLSAAGKIRKWLGEGKVVVCNRYVGSNMAHMGAKFKDEGSRMKFIKWLEDLEYGENQIPKEDLVILLEVPVAVSRDLIKNRKLDIHEKDLEYLQNVLDQYSQYAKNRKNWVRVDCTKEGQILKPDIIHKKVLAVIESNGILRT